MLTLLSGFAAFPPTSFQLSVQTWRGPGLALSAPFDESQLLSGEIPAASLPSLSTGWSGQQRAHTHDQHTLNNSSLPSVKTLSIQKLHFSFDVLNPYLSRGPKTEKSHKVIEPFSSVPSKFS